MCNQVICSERHQKALDYALEAIRKSPIFPYVEAVYLYGSCARGEETRRSDVDLFLELKVCFEGKKAELRLPYRLLKSEVQTGDIRNPEVDLKIVIGDEWKTNKIPYFGCVKKEGKLLCL